MNISIVGAGRAGSSFDTALERVGHHVVLVHHDDVSSIGDSSPVTFTPSTDTDSGGARALVAAIVDGVRLIDNGPVLLKGER